VSCRPANDQRPDSGRHERADVALTRIRTASKTPWQRFAEGVCRRAFSSPEALAYELTIAPALAAVVVPCLLPLISGRRVLDVGCGGGAIASQIATDRQVGVVGIDPSTSQIRRFARRSRTLPAVAGIQARAEHLHFRDASFDTVISSCAWKHWSSPGLGIAECVRVLRPGGTLLVVEVDGSTTPAGFWRFAQTSRIPLGMRRAYVRFSMRTVVGVAPDATTLERSFDAAAPLRPSIGRIKDLPFLIAIVTLPVSASRARSSPAFAAASRPG
jgi:ubiquinone/menaquinone biosynthesis C-methylase UbiE